MRQLQSKASVVGGARVIGSNLSALLAVPLVIIAMSLPISPGGLGVGEAAASQLFAEFGLANGALVVLVVRLGVVVISLPGAAALFGTAVAPPAPLSDETSA